MESRKTCYRCQWSRKCEIKFVFHLFDLSLLLVFQDMSVKDVHERDLVSYRDKVINACARGREPPTLAVHLKRKSNEGDVSKAVWEDYWNHVKLMGPASKVLHEFIQDYKTTNPERQLIWGRPETKACTHGDLLLGDDKTALSFTNAIFGFGKSKKEKEADWMLNRVIDAQGNWMMEKLAEAQNNAPYKQSLSKPILPIADDPFPQTEENMEANKQTLLHLRNFINDVKLSNIQSVIRTKWGGAKSAKYTLMQWDPRLLPKEESKKTFLHMANLFNRAFFAKGKKIFSTWEETAKNIRSMNANDLVQLEWYMRWMQRQLNDEFSRGTLKVNKDEKMTPSELKKGVDKAYQVELTGKGPPMPPRDTESKIPFAFAAERLGQIRGMLLGDLKNMSLPDTASSILIHPSFAKQNYPDKSNPEHVTFIHNLVGGTGWGPGMLTPSERAIYDATLDKPLPYHADKELLSLCAYSKAAMRMDAKLNEALDENELAMHANAIMVENNTPEKYNNLIHQACSAHVSVSNKPLLDIDGPYLTVKNAYEGNKTGWDKTDPNKVAIVLRGISNLLSSNEQSSHKQSKNTLISQIFNMHHTKAQKELREIVKAAASHVRGNGMVETSMTERDLQHFGSLTGAFVPFAISAYVGDGYSSDEGDSESDNDSDGEIRSGLIVGMYYYDEDRETETFVEPMAAKETPIKPKSDSIVIPKPVEKPAAPKIMSSQAMLLQKIKSAKATMTNPANLKVIADLAPYNNHIVFVPEKVTKEGNTWVPDAHVVYASPNNINRIVADGVVKMTNTRECMLANLVGPEKALELRNQLKTHSWKGTPLKISIPLALQEAPIKR